ncbi:DUF805 domain-containing protein [Sphingomonas oryzagri]
MIPSIAVSVRRLHDVNRSGWWMVAPLLLLGVAMVSALARLGATPDASMLGFGIFFMVAMLIGVVLSILLLVWACMHGTIGPNRFGPDPYAPIGDLHVARQLGRPVGVNYDGR